MSKLANSLEELLSTFKKLRNPDTGCPWDKEQDFKSIASCAIEEAYEVADAIEREDFESLKAELGDLLFQIVFHAEMAKEQNLFNLNEIVDELNSKLIRRHPHVFADSSTDTAKGSLEIWENVKAQERKDKNLDSILDDVATNLPSLTRAKKLQKRAKRVGFDWNDSDEVMKKLDEEIAELKFEHDKKSKAGISEEMGDIFFTLVNLSRYYDIEPEDVIRRTNLKFEKRFKDMENLSKDRGKTLDGMSLEEMEQLWQEVK